MQGGIRTGAGRPRGVRDSRPRKPRAAVKVSSATRTSSLRASVALLAAAGVAHESMAKTLGMTITTLRTRFAEELADDGALAHARNLLRLQEAADSGSIAAIKMIDDIIGRTHDGDRLQRRSSHGDNAHDHVSGQPLGKKERALAAALMPDLSTHMGRLMALRAAMAND